MIWKQPKITASILDELHEEVLHPPWSRLAGISEQARTRTTTENEEDDIKVGVCFLSLFSQRFYSSLSS